MSLLDRRCRKTLSESLISPDVLVSARPGSLGFAAPLSLALVFTGSLPATNPIIYTALLIAALVMAALVFLAAYRFREDKRKMTALVKSLRETGESSDLCDKKFRFSGELNLITCEINRIIGEKRLAEKRRIGIEQKYRDFIDEAPIGYFTSTGDGKFLLVNQRLAKMLGYENAETAVKEVRCLQQNLYRYPGDRQQLLEKIVFEGVLQAEQVQFKKSDGSVIWVEITAKGTNNSSGEVEIINGYITDITEQVRCRKIMEDLSNTDGLTGIYNRRYFTHLASIELQRSKRYNEEISLLVIDLDNFKKINDTLGHAVGDRVLKGLSVIVAEAIREHDIFGRLGGEEFILLMPQTGRIGAMDAGERIRLILKSALRHITDDKELISPTVSIGVTSVEGFDIDLNLDELIKVAEEAMYKAKVAGRNCVRYKSY